MKPLLVSVKHARILLGIGNTKIYAMLSDRSLERRKIGSRTLITIRSVEKLAGVEIDPDAFQRKIAVNDNNPAYDLATLKKLTDLQQFLRDSDR